jgi:hypothetical protein
MSPVKRSWWTGVCTWGNFDAGDLDAREKKPGLPGFFQGRKWLAPMSRLGWTDIRRLIAFWTGRLVVSDLLILLKRFETIALDGGEMRKQILASVIRSNESVSFRIVEPLDGT